MWKYIKGTEKDFENYPEDSEMVVRIQGMDLSVKNTNRGVFNCLDTKQGWCKSGIQDMDFLCIIAQREWVKEFVGETPLPTKEQMNPSKDLPKIKLDVKKPVFYKETDEEVRFIHSNNLYHLFEKEDCTILNVTTDNLDNCFYNKPETKTTVEVLDSAWKRACNAGVLWASPTQLFYMAIEQLVKSKVIDMDKTYEVEE